MIRISESAIKVMEAQGEKDFPNECCGFLYGTDGDIRKILDARPVINSREGDQRRRFTISPQDYMAAERYALENNTTLLGIYHTHPNHPAIASEHDRRQAMPYFSYVILSVQEGKSDHLRSWRLLDEVDETSFQTFGEEEIDALPARLRVQVQAGNANK